MGKSSRPPEEGGDHIEPVDLKAALEERYLAYALESLGILACLRRESEEAFGLVGAATTARRAIGAPRAPVDQARVDRWLATVAPGLSPEAQQSAWSLGAVTPILDLIRAYRTSPEEPRQENR